MDRITPETRSRNMARIRNTRTRPEMFIRSALHKKGMRFRVNYKPVIGTPDIYFTGKKAAVFIHGCFWHQHPGCKFASTPTSNQEYWIPKLERNMTRDQEVLVSLNENGIRVLVVWECTVKLMMKDAVYRDMILDQIIGYINNDRGPALSV